MVTGRADVFEGALDPRHRVIEHGPTRVVRAAQPTPSKLPRPTPVASSGDAAVPESAAPARWVANAERGTEFAKLNEPAAGKNATSGEKGYTEENVPTTVPAGSPFSAVGVDNGHAGRVVPRASRNSAGWINLDGPGVVRCSRGRTPFLTRRDANQPVDEPERRSFQESTQCRVQVVVGVPAPRQPGRAAISRAAPLKN